MKLPGVIFDFDGVVVDSLGAHISAWRTASIEIFGQDFPEDIRRTLPGRSTAAIASILSNFFRAPSKSQELANSKRRILSAQQHTIELLPGAREVMQILREQNVPFGIASNAPRAFVHATTKAHGLKVDVMLGVEDALRPKPAPDLFLACARALRIPHLDDPKVLVFEDSLHGLKAAVDARMHPIGLMTQHSPSELLAAGARLAYVNLAEALVAGIFDSQLD